MTMYERIRRRLIARRTELKVPQRSLAQRMGTTQSAISDLERGHTVDPMMSTVERWAAALDLDLVLLTRKDEFPRGYTRREKAILREIGEAECILAEALGYTYDKEYGWVTGDHTIVTLAMEVRSRGVKERDGQEA